MMIMRQVRCKARSTFRRLCSSPVSAVRPQHAFDSEDLYRYLTSHGIEGFQNHSQISCHQFAHGQSNPTFALTSSSGQKYVMRKQPPGQLLQGAHAIDREYKVMAALQNTNVPVPRTLLHCSDAAVIGTPFFIYEYIDGKFYKEAALPTIAHKSTRQHIYYNMINTLARLHAVDVDAVGLADFGKRVTAESPAVTSGYIIRQVKTWTKQYRATETERLEDMEYLLASLVELLPTSAENTSCLVHGDYRMDNLIFTGVEGHVAGVLDWELSTLGDGYSDLSYNLMAYHLSPTNPFMKGLRGLDIDALGIPTISDLVNHYGKQLQKYSGLSPPSLVDMDYYLAFSFFRTTAILQGVYKRSLLGNASATNASAALDFAKETSRLGASLLKKYRKNSSLGPSVGSDFASPAFNAFSSESRDLYRIPPICETMISSHARELLHQLNHFMITQVLPQESSLLQHMYESENKWSVPVGIEALKQQAREMKLWNLFLPRESDASGCYGAGLTNAEYALMAEIMGRSLVAPEVFNCNAPDTGNMEVLVRYGTEAQKKEWLIPLLHGDIRSCFAMTEPSVASSDATNIEATVQVSGEDVILKGRKWFISGALDPRCKVIIFMGRRHDAAAYPVHQRHTMVLVPMNTVGVTVVRPMRVFGYDDAPHGHAEMIFDNVRVPKENIILGEGRGFEIAQGRLGPGRIHHCMRLIGSAERALEMMCSRATNRIAFGKTLAEQGSIQKDIAFCRVEIDQARLLCMNAAHNMDKHGNKIAKNDIAAIKIVSPSLAKRVIDAAIQTHGALGVSQDAVLAHLYANARSLQLADGPDEVHWTALAKAELKKVPPLQSKVKKFDP